MKSHTERHKICSAHSTKFLLRASQHKHCDVQTRHTTYSQELLGYHLGLIVDKKDQDLFWNARTEKGLELVMEPKCQRNNSVQFGFQEIKNSSKITILPIENFKTKKN